MSKDTRPTRRQALLGDRPGSYAIARQVRMSPTKVRRVVDMIRGMDVEDALNTCRFSPQAASEPVYKVIASATANAERSDNLRRATCTSPRRLSTRASPSDGSGRGREVVGAASSSGPVTSPSSSNPEPNWQSAAKRAPARRRSEHGAKDQSVRLSPRHFH